MRRNNIQKTLAGLVVVGIIAIIICKCSCSKIDRTPKQITYKIVVRESNDSMVLKVYEYVIDTVYIEKVKKPSRFIPK